MLTVSKTESSIPSSKLPRPCHFYAPPPPDSPPPSNQSFADNVINNATSSVFFSYFSSLDPISSMILGSSEADQDINGNIDRSDFGGQVSLTRHDSLSSGNILMSCFLWNVMIKKAVIIFFFKFFLNFFSIIYSKPNIFFFCLFSFHRISNSCSL